jgi:hypothetical protein
MLKLTWRRAAAWRVQRHHLDRRAPAGSMLAVASRLCGLHAQLMSSAELSVWARSAKRCVRWRFLSRRAPAARRSAAPRLSAAGMDFAGPAGQWPHGGHVAPRHQRQPCRSGHRAVRQAAGVGAPRRGPGSRAPCRVPRREVEPRLEEVTMKCRIATTLQAPLHPLSLAQHVYAGSRGRLHIRSRSRS